MDPNVKNNREHSESVLFINHSHIFDGGSNPINLEPAGL